MAAALFVPNVAEAADFDAARRLSAAGKYAECAAVAAAAIREGVHSEDWAELKMECELRLGRSRQALATLEAALDEHRRSIRLRWIGHRVLLHNNELDRAGKLLQEIEELATRSSYRYSDAANRIVLGQFFLERGGDARQVLETFFDPVKKSRPELAAPYLAAGELALSKSDFALAAEEFQSALKRSPNDPDAHFGLVRAYAPSDPERATASLQAALKQNPNHIPAWLYMVDDHIDAERYTEAEELLGRVLDVNPKHPRAWAYRAVLAHLRSDDDAERQARETALSTWTRNPEVDHLIGKKLSQKYRFAEGAEYQRQALRFDERYLPAHLQLAQDLLRLGREQEGWRRAELVYDQDEYNVVAHNLVRLQHNLARFRTLENDDFLVRMDAREAAIYGDRVLELLAEAKSVLCAKYEVTIDEPVVIEIFPQQQDFAIRTFGLPGGAGFLGVCFGRVITANSPASQGESPSNLEALLWHEYCHVVTLHKTRNKMPRWLSEGISVYEENQASRSWGQHMNPRYREMILGGDLTPVSALSGAFLQPPSPMHLQFAYFESALVVEYLFEKHGLEVVKQILSDLGTGMPINEVLDRHTGSLAELDRNFEQYARAKAQALAPDATWEELPFAGETALADVAEWLEQHPQNFVALRLYAKLLMAEKRWEEARTVLEKMIELCPDYVGTDNAYVHLAQLHRQAGEPEKEKAALEQVALRRGDATDVFLRLMELAAAENDWREVARQAERMLAVNPLVAIPHRYRAQSAEQLGETNRAIRAYRALLQLDPADPADIHFRLASNLHAQGDLDQAQRQVLMALEEAPRFLDAHRLLLAIVAAGETDSDTDSETDSDTIGDTVADSEEGRP